MPFLTDCPDLSNTIFTDNDLQKARQYLYSVIARINLPWLKKPKGPLGKHWNIGNTYSACFLIDVAQVVHAFEHRITQRSLPLFPSKVNGILEPPSEREFVENLTEFQVAFGLTEYIRQLDVDPMVPAEDLLSSSKGQRPKTPDFSFQLPDCTVFLDATVLHIAALDEWDKCMDSLTSALQQHLRKQQRNVCINITLPFPFFGDICRVTRVLKSKIDEFPSGKMDIGSGGKVEWEPMPFIIADDASSALSTFSTMSSPMAIFGPSEGYTRNAFAQWRSIATMPEEDVNKANKLLFNSLRNTLNRKQDQMPHQKPSLLVIRLGHHRLLAGRLVKKIEERIWPNPQYDWLTGIVLFTPREGFAKADRKPCLTLNANPEAHCPASPSLLSLFGASVK